MRIIVRAWHELLKEYVDPFKYCALIDGELAGDHINLEQHTGLNDKNGVKIFEGDIVKLKSIDHEKGGWVSNRQCKGRVEFNDVWGVRFICKDLTQRTADSHWGINLNSRECCNIQVIGNIHQNPELLK